MLNHSPHAMFPLGIRNSGLRNLRSWNLEFSVSSKFHKLKFSCLLQTSWILCCISRARMSCEQKFDSSLKEPNSSTLIKMHIHCLCMPFWSCFLCIWKVTIAHLWNWHMCSWYKNMLLGCRPGLIIPPRKHAFHHKWQILP